MRVDGLNIVLRQRPPWEAVDLGFSLVRRHARVIFLSWALATLPLMLLLTAVLAPFELVWLAGILFWWLKPAFDRLPLYVLSRSILGQAPTVAETLRQLSWGWHRLWPWLLWRRLHPARSLLLAVDFLEQPKGEARRQRVRLIARGQQSTPTLVWVVGAHLETMLWASAILFVLMFVPTEFLDDSLKAAFDLLIEDPPVWAQALQNLGYWACVLLIEPFYVGAGFALYLNRRTDLEAWDVELAFRRLAVRAAGIGQAATLALALLTAVVFSAPWGVASAADLGSPTDPPSASHDVELDEHAQAPTLDQLFAPSMQPKDAGFDDAIIALDDDELLHPKELVGSWRQRSPGSANEPSEQPAWLRTLSLVLAWVLEHLLWLLLGLGLIWLALRAPSWIRDWQATPASASAAALSDATSIAAEQRIPQDVVTAIRRMWNEGRQRAAMSLLYRGAVDVMVKRSAQGLPPGATEAEVLRLARSSGDSQLAHWLSDVVRLWQRAAYAHRFPDEGDLFPLLDRWAGGQRLAADLSPDTTS